MSAPSGLVSRRTAARLYASGHVSIYSEPGLGTTVRLYLPRVGAEASRPSDIDKPDEEAAPRGRETILVAEDDPFVRASVVRQLESLGYTVISAVAGDDALAKLRVNPEIDMLFTDIICRAA